jgi:hypothetical protein
MINAVPVRRPRSNSVQCGIGRRNPVMKAWSVIGLLLTGAIIATIPISPQVTPRGVELSVDQAQARTYGHYRRAYRRGYNYRATQPIGGGGGQWYPG